MHIDHYDHHDHHGERDMCAAYSDDPTISFSGSHYRTHGGLRVAARQRVAGGKVIAGRYELKRTIGEGSFGEVYAATRLSDGAAVAIKMLQQPDSAQLARFHEEARLLRQAQHANVVRVLDSCSAANDAAACLVMEQLTGPNLAERLERGPLAIREVLELARDALRAIDAFSSRGIVHRDLKPGNLVSHQVGRTRVWKVIDFGIAMRTSQPDAVSSEMVVGTPRYMAPEQLRGEAIDVRADLFALGALLYEAITGEPCYGRGSLVDVIAATLHDEVPPLRELRPECPLELEQLVLRALEKDAQKRPQSAREMLCEVEGLLSRPARSRWSLAALSGLLWPRRPRRAFAPVVMAPPSPDSFTSRSFAETAILPTAALRGSAQRCVA